jgi:hypothetical protein
MANSIRSEYEARKSYNHPNSKKLRAELSGTGKKVDPVTALKAQQRGEKIAQGHKHREETLALERRLNARRGQSPHISHADDDTRQRRALDAKHRDADERLARHHRAQLDQAMARHMPA